MLQDRGEVLSFWLPSGYLHKRHPSLHLLTSRTFPPLLPRSSGLKTRTKHSEQSPGCAMRCQGWVGMMPELPCRSGTTKAEQSSPGGCGHGPGEGMTKQDSSLDAFWCQVPCYHLQWYWVLPLLSCCCWTTVYVHKTWTEMCVEGPR